MDNGNKTWSLEEEDNSTETNQSLKAIGKETFPMAQEGKYSAMDKSMKESGSMVEWKVKEFTLKKTRQPTQDIGWTTFSMAMVMKNGLREHSTKEIFSMELNKVMESWPWLMEANIKASLNKTEFKVMDISSGLMENSMRDSGKTIKCMGKVTSSGQMVESMTDSMSMGKKKDMASFYGRMEECTKVNGKTTNKMEEECTSIGKEQKKLEFGAMAERFDGLIDQ